MLDPSFKSRCDIHCTSPVKLVVRIKPGMPGKIWLVRKYGSTTGLTGQKWPPNMYFVSKPVHTCSDWMYLTNTSEYFMTFTEKKKCRFLLTNIIKLLFSMTCNFFCHFFGDLTSAIMPCLFQTPLLTYIGTSSRCSSYRNHGIGLGQECVTL